MHFKVQKSLCTGPEKKHSEQGAAPPCRRQSWVGSLAPHLIPKHNKTKTQVAQVACRPSASFPAQQMRRQRGRAWHHLPRAPTDKAADTTRGLAHLSARPGRRARPVLCPEGPHRRLDAGASAARDSTTLSADFEAGQEAKKERSPARALGKCSSGAGRMMGNIVSRSAPPELSRDLAS